MVRLLLFSVALMLYAAPAAYADTADQRRTQLLPLAQQGDANAQFELGMSYCCGNGPGYNSQEALTWLCRSALHGHADAQFQLGKFYGIRLKEQPFRTPDNRAYAYMWYSAAAQQGHTLAEAYRVALAQDMTHGQVERGLEWAGKIQEVGCPGVR